VNGFSVDSGDIDIALYANVIGSIYKSEEAIKFTNLSAD